MNVEKTPIPGLLVIKPRIFNDPRGFFFESFNHEAFLKVLKEDGQPAVDFVQDNHSCSSKGVLRGLHFQRDPHAQGKLVRVVKGAAWDVAVDIRPGSPTLGQWFGIKLDAEEHTMLWVPPGFAHGFQALEDDTHFLYKTTAYYAPESEGSIAYNDPELGIKWPLQDPVLNQKDLDAPSMRLTHL